MQAVRLLPIMAAAIVPISSAPASGSPRPGDPLLVPEGYSEVWSEDFSSRLTPSAERWHWDTHRNRLGWYNNELQYYSRQSGSNARIENGRLVIEARYEDWGQAHPRDWAGQNYSSARLTTRGKARWKNGFFEVRAKLPCTRGAWPAIWLLPDTHSGHWYGGEIDLAEWVAQSPATVHHALHTPDRNFRNGNPFEATSPLAGCEAFHDYQALWTPEFVAVGVDGKTALVAPGKPFDRPMSLILNVAIGGHWAGSLGVDNSALPAQMEVEQVRVWQRDGSQ